MLPQFYDYHNIDSNYAKLKQLVKEVESDIYKFIGPTRNRSAGRRARKKLARIRDLAHKINMSVMYQGQSYDSEY